MSDLLNPPGAFAREGVSHRVSASSAEVWKSDLRPLVDAPPSWVSDVAQTLSRFLKVERSVNPQPAIELIECLNDSVWADAPVPFVSSTEARGVSAEFDAPGIHIHVEFDGAGDGSIYVLQGKVFDWDGPIQDLPDGIAKWAWRLGVASREHH
jgi:hypothetical protein